MENLRNASVSEYLLRLHYQDLFFLSNTEVLGLVIEGNSRAILTRQNIIEGATPTEKELHEMMNHMGATLISKGSGTGYTGAVYEYFSSFYIADVRADNCRLVECREGEFCLASFDLIISPKEGMHFLI